jgi:hypothetical protein
MQLGSPGIAVYGGRGRGRPLEVERLLNSGERPRAPSVGKCPPRTSSFQAGKSAPGMYRSAPAGHSCNEGRGSLSLHSFGERWGQKAERESARSRLAGCRRYPGFRLFPVDRLASDYWGSNSALQL